METGANRGHCAASMMPLDSCIRGHGAASTMPLDPLSLAYKIYPDTVNPKQNLIIYTFSEADAVEHSFYSTLYQIPYSPETFWTHMRFVSEPLHAYRLDLLLITSNGDCKTLASSSQTTEWVFTEWPLPSFPTGQAGLYLSLHYPKEPGNYEPPITITILGFLRLFPIAERYLLYSHNQYQMFLFLRDEPCTYRALTDREGMEDQGVRIRPSMHYH